MIMMRTAIDIFGKKITYECMGCETADHKLIPPGGYVYEDDFINVAADFEVPIPGFMILGINKHYHSINQMTEQERAKIMQVLNYTIEKVKKVCQVEDVTIIQEERCKHFHIWILPSYAWMNQYGKGSIGIKDKFEVAKQKNNADNIENCLTKVAEIRNEFKLISRNNEKNRN